MSFSATTPEYVTTLNGLFKMVYANEITNLIPDGVKALKMYKFSEADRIGNKFNFPVKVTHPQSVTYAAAGDGAFALNDIVAGQSKNAEVDGAQLLLRDAMDYEAAAKASEGGQRAFMKATRFMVEGMIEQAAKRLEIDLFYGRSTMGIIESETDLGSGTHSIVLTAASFAPHFWSGMEGARIMVYANDASTGHAGHSSNDLYITSVDITNRTLTLAGDNTELDAVVATDYIYFKGAKSKSYYGIDYILTNTSTLFGIDASAYPLWAGSSYSAGSAAFSLSKIEAACAQAAGKGGLDGEASCWVSLSTWANLCSDMAALRMFDGSYGKQGVNGFESIKFFAVNGPVEVIPSGYIKGGDAFILPKSGIMRIGATDMTFNIPGQANESDERFFFPIANYAGFELRLFSHQALVIKTPAKCVKITNIVNS
jgi:hypothetical protein